MKRFFIILALLPLTLLFTSCKEKDTPQQDTDEYYVKYTITSFVYFGNIYYADVNGTKTARTGNTFSPHLKWEVTIGPVKKGFNAFVRYEKGKANRVRIEVSKNGAPFALKDSGSDGASYVIDF